MQLELPIGQILAPGKAAGEGVWNKRLSPTSKTRAMTQERQEMKVCRGLSWTHSDVNPGCAAEHRAAGQTFLISGLLPSDTVMWKDVAISRKVQRVYFACMRACVSMSAC